MAKFPIFLHYFVTAAEETENTADKTDFQIQKQTVLPRIMFCFSNNTPFQQFKNRAEVTVCWATASPPRPDSAPAHGVRVVTRLTEQAEAPSCPALPGQGRLTWVRALPLLSNTCEHPQPSQSASPSPNYPRCPLWQGRGGPAHPQPSQSSSPSPNYPWCPLWQAKGGPAATLQHRW